MKQELNLKQVKPVKTMTRSGSIGIPIDIRRAKSYTSNDRFVVDVSDDGDIIVLTRLTKACFITGSNKDLLHLGDGIYVSKDLITIDNIEDMLVKWKSKELVEYAEYLTGSSFKNKNKLKDKSKKNTDNNQISFESIISEDNKKSIKKVSKPKKEDSKKKSDDKIKKVVEDKEIDDVKKVKQKDKEVIKKNKEVKQKEKTDVVFKDVDKEEVSSRRERKDKKNKMKKY